MRHVVAAAALVALVVLVYGTSAENQFVFDDQPLIVDNPMVQLPLAQAHELFAGTAKGVAYRPLRVFSYMIDFHVAGRLDPRTFHRSNIAYHAATVLALYALAWLTLGSLPGALSAAALFAVHPLGSEAVAYVAGRRDLLSTLFVLLALLCWCALLRHAPAAATYGRGRARGRSAGGRRGVAVASMILFSVLAVAAKEMAIVVPPLMLLLWLAMRGGATARAAGGASIWFGWLACVAALAAGGLWLYAGPLAPRLAEVAGGSLAPQPALSLRVLGQYMSLAVWPVRLSADYRPYAFALPTSALDGPSLMAALAITVVVVAGVVLLARGQIAGAGLLWFLVSLLPVAQIVPYSEVVSEHNGYLALAGLSLAVGQAVALGMRSRPRLVGAVAAGIVLLLALRSHARSADWHDNTTLWRATLRTAPRSVRAQYNLGVALLADGNLLGARDALEQATALAPSDSDALLLLATVSGRLGEFDRAYELAARATEVRRDVPSLTALGWAQLSRGNARDAIPLFDEAIGLGGDTSEALRGLARARAGAGRF
jgi:hypothetical protein